MTAVDDDCGDSSDPPFKRICVRYGLAMYFVQLLEHGIVNALVWFDLFEKARGRWTPEEFDRYYDSRFSETLRELSKRLQKFAEIPEDLGARLDEANRRRRFLAHHFFRETAEAIDLDQIEQVIERLENDRRFFHETDRMLEALLEPIFERVGFTKEIRAKVEADYREELEFRRNARR
ncbi:hypothetical protein SAMN05216570_0041 [Dyella sp. OK004]|uniref:hypothetical protein n=1 Tax=Dyella sp. OK004 TaxID=1855292 RepID=UPI0008E9DA2A|nr:hypothetical protein [Dyella sp. OK004]SFR85665.1 hypothetical protein SAMN05216570_0041 [Dyella sp. OK004]